MKLKAGQIAPKTCTCNLCNQSGKKIKVVAIKKGSRLPATPSIKDYYDIAE